MDTNIQIAEGDSARDSREGKALISLIVPTRGRPENLQRLARSLLANTAEPDQVELVLVIDEDDESYAGLTLDGLRVTYVRSPAGSAMGALNMAGYSASSGDYIMLMNDDVVLRTPAWDKTVLSVFKAHPDGVVLVHVNDRLFESRLCTFPFVTRMFCELSGGVTQSDYYRYRIDDHIYEVFNLLSVLGHDRIVYLPDVIFEHLNFVTDESGKIEYQPNPVIHQADTERFAGYRPKRKALTLKLADIIDEHRRQQKQLINGLLLEPDFDTNELRRPETVRVLSSSEPPKSQRVRVTIGVVTADIRSKYAQACLHAIKAHTSNYDLIVLDNSRGPNFNHPREMNRILSICRTDFLVLMDDDVIVEAGWLDGLLSAVTPEVGVVTPLHKSADGKMSYAGVVMRPDYTGNHTHAFALYPHAFPIQTLCSAIMLIDVKKCGDIFVDESYSKYFLDIDYGLRVWEAGFSVVCAPNVIVTHIGGGTLGWSTQRSMELVSVQREHFERSWIKTGRYFKIENGPLWAASPEIRAILDLPKRLESFLHTPPSAEPSRTLAEAHAFAEELDHYPTVKDWVGDQLMTVVEKRPADFRRPEDQRYAALVGQFYVPVPVEHLDDKTIVCLWRGNYYAMPVETRFDNAHAAAGLYRSAPSLDLLRISIHGNVEFPPPFEIEDLLPKLIEEGYKGFNLVQLDVIYALAQAEGAFDVERAKRGDYQIRGFSANEVKSIIDALQPVLIEEGYRGHNVIRYDRIYAIAQSAGAFDPSRAVSGGYETSGDSVESVKAQIDALAPFATIEANWASA